MSIAEGYKNLVPVLGDICALNHQCGPDFTVIGLQRIINNERHVTVAWVGRDGDYRTADIPLWALTRYTL